MTPGLPLFPLGTVLFPGLVLPLHVFEERYRALVRHLRDLPDGTPREFGVVAIQRGWETTDGLVLRRPTGSAKDREPASLDGASGRGEPPKLYEIGCTAQVRQITERPDGRFDLVAVGGRRFAIDTVDTSAAPYLVAQVHWLPDDEGAPGESDELAGTVLALFQRYLRLIRPRQPGEQLPDDPTVLSHLVAATAALPLPERQALLAAPDTAGRLRRERALLGREVAFLHQVRAVPVPLPELAVAPSPN